MKFGITDSFECSYLDDRQERLLVYVGNQRFSSIEDYEMMLEAGFRRSGDQVYRPQCPQCNACRSLRLHVNDFKPSKNQKRILNKNSDLVCRISREDKPKYYELYRDYIKARHSDGSMFPPTPEQYTHFLHSAWAPTLFIELSLNDRIIAVAVTDELPNSLSALYTFYDPNLEERSLGTLAILNQIQQAQNIGKKYLYLGYQIDSCQKMNYKTKFMPNEQYIDHQWITFQKKRN